MNSEQFKEACRNFELEIATIRVSQSFNGIVQSAVFLTVKASLSPQNASLTHAYDALNYT